MSSYIQIKAQIEKLQKEAEAVRKREIAETVANIKKAIQAFGLTAADLGLTISVRGRKSGKSATVRRGRPPKVAQKASQSAAAKVKKASGKGANDRRSVVAPKFRDQASGATWTGRGKQPKWLSAAIAAGRKLDDFRI